MAYLAIHREGKLIGTHRLDGACLIGRAIECDLTLCDPRLSRAHCRIERLGDGRWVVRDLGSRNGTLVGSRTETSRHGVILHGGMAIHLGHLRLDFYDGAPEAFEPDLTPTRPADAADAILAARINLSCKDTLIASAPVGLRRPLPTPGITQVGAAVTPRSSDRRLGQFTIVRPAPAPRPVPRGDEDPFDFVDPPSGFCPPSS